MANLFTCSVYKEAKWSSKYTIYRMTLSHDGYIVLKAVQKPFSRENDTQIFQCIPELRYRHFGSQLGHGIELSNDDDDSSISFVVAKLVHFREFVVALCSITTVIGIELHWTKAESSTPAGSVSSPTRRRTSLVVISSRDEGDAASGAQAATSSEKQQPTIDIEVCIPPDKNFCPGEISFPGDEEIRVSVQSSSVTFSLSNVVCSSPASTDNEHPIIITELPEISKSFELRFRNRDAALTYLRNLSRAAAVHNIPSYLVDMGWVADATISVMHNAAEKQQIHEPAKEAKVDITDNKKSTQDNSSDDESSISVQRRQLALSMRRPQTKELSPSSLLQLLQEAPVADIGKLGLELNLSGVDLSREKNMAAVGRICCISVSEAMSMLSTSHWTGLFDVMVHEYAMTSRKNIAKRPAVGVVEPVHITSLNMSESGVTPLSLRQLSLCATGLHRIRRLVICGNDLNIESAAAIASVIRKGALEFLDMTGSRLGDDGVTVIAQALHGNKELSTLILSKNNISTSGIGQLCIALPQTSIQTLSLASNSLNKTAIHWISNCLQSKCSLLSLDLSHQSPKISPIGAVYLAKALRHNCILQYLYLQRNRIGSEGSRHIAGSLTSNSTLLGLNISRNKVRVSGALHLGKALATSNRSLQWIVLGERVLPISYLRGEGGVHAPKTCDLTAKGLPFIGSTEDASKLGLNIAAQANNVYDRDSVKDPSTETIIDDEAILISQLLLHNSRLISLKLEEAQLPIQALRGDNVLEENYELDLSGAGLRCCDAIIVGVLVANNSSLTKLNVKGNNFQNTEGEVWIAAALERNPKLNLDTALWPAEDMYADGYYLLAAMRGVSASGATIEPQRVDSLLYCLFLIFGACSYYADVLSDIYVTMIYAEHPNIYPRGWLICSIFLLSLPTFIAVYAIVTSLCRHSPYTAMLQIFSVVCQIHPLSQVYVSIATGIETTAYFKFLEGVYENIPQLFFQSYVMFRVGITEGEFEVAVLGSILISLTSVSSVLVMVADRGKIRKQSLGAVDDNPKCVQLVANSIACFFGISFDEKHIKNIINYTSYLMSHWFWALCCHCCMLCVRVVALTWLLAGIENQKYVVFLVCFVPRIFMVLFLDPRSKHRPLFRNILWTLCYCLLGSVWDKDEKQAILSRKVYLLMYGLCTVENVVFLAYAAFLSQDSHMDSDAAAAVFGGGVFLQLLCWVLLRLWRLPVHFPEMSELMPQSAENDKLRFICPQTRGRTMEHWYNYLSIAGPQQRESVPESSAELVVKRRMNGTRRVSIRKPDDEKLQSDEALPPVTRQKSHRSSQHIIPPKRQSIEQRTEPLRRVTALLEYSYFDTSNTRRGKQPDNVVKSSSFTWTENPNFV